MSSKDLMISVSGGQINPTIFTRPNSVTRLKKNTQDPQLGVNDPKWVGREVEKRIIMRNRRMPHTMSS